MEPDLFGFIDIWHDFRVLIPQGLSLSRNGFEVKEIKLNRSSVRKLALETAFWEVRGWGGRTSHWLWGGNAPGSVGSSLAPHTPVK